MKLYERIENNNFDEIDKNRAIELIESGNGNLVYNENYFKLQKENEELKNKIMEKELEIIGKEEYTKASMGEIIEQYYTANEECIPAQKVKDKIEELQKEYNKLDKQFDEYIKSVEKNVSTYYENKERISIMQTLSYFIEILQELIEEREEN